jgi:hypothetical protein
MLRFWLAATTALAMTTGIALAQTLLATGPTAPQQPRVEEPIMTLSGSAAAIGNVASAAHTTVPDAGNQTLPVSTGNAGPMAPIPISGAGSQGMSIDNGNATSAIVPGQPPKLISTPE